jgi:hypothetical protein
MSDRRREAQLVALRADLMRVARLLGLPDGAAPSPEAYRRHGQVSVRRAVFLATGSHLRTGNGWKDAMRRLFLLPMSEVTPDPEQIIDDLRRVASLVGNPAHLPPRSAYRRYGRFGDHVVTSVLLPQDAPRHWSLLATVAGFEMPSPAELRRAAISAYRLLAQRLGYTPGGVGPSRQEWRQYCEENPFMGERVMGGFAALVRAAGYRPKRADSRSLDAPTGSAEGLDRIT